MSLHSSFSIHHSAFAAVAAAAAILSDIDIVFAIGFRAIAR